MLEERREQASVIVEVRQQQVTRYHNNRVRTKTFSIKDLVLQKSKIGKGNAGIGKLRPNGEGPY